MVPLDLADRLSVSVGPPGANDTLHVDGFDPGPAADNLVLRAIAAARRAARPAWGRPDVPPPLAARLEKRIPVAAGLAGGSSDAAAAADAALEAWGVDLDGDARHALFADWAPTSRSSSWAARRSSRGAASTSRRSAGSGTPTTGTIVRGCC